MEELISKKDLFEKAAEWEAQAWDMVDKYSPDNDPKNNWEEWYKWSNILRERSGFKHTVMDAPTIIEMPDTGIGDLSDGYHTFNGLYEQRAILFVALVKAYKDKSWKSHRHEDGEPCFGGGWFIVGIDTPEGSYTYHYENKYWDMFDCVDLPRAKHWDGHTEEDAETRLMSLKPEPHWIPATERFPENEVNVLITVEHRPIGRKSYRRVVRAFHEDGTWSDIRSAYSWDDDSWDDYVDEDGIVLIPEGWFEAIDYHGEFCAVDDFVIAWMPLPEPYKGVTE